jgi:hypothetical protein
MKIAVLLVLVLAVSSCASSYDQNKNPNGHQQPVENTREMQVADPCQDSLFLALQNKPYSELTAYEHAYFQQKWDECNGTPAVNHGSTPEWILAGFEIVGAILIFVIEAAR